MHFCIAETLDVRSRHNKINGFSSIFPLTVSAYERLKTASLHHDDIDRDDLVDGVFDNGLGLRAEPTVLFVLDLEWIRAGIARRGTLYLTVDLIETIRQACLRVQVVAIAALGATDAGKKWIESLGFSGAGMAQHAYFPLEHSNWTLYEASAAKMNKITDELGRLGWPDMSQRKYPYLVGQQLEAGRKALNHFAAGRRLGRAVGGRVRKQV